MANEVRLIDANALRDDTYIFDAWDAKVVRAWLDDQPTVDAVEVVRCKDCKHRETLFGKMCCDYNDDVVQENHFCSCGERREGE